MKKIFFIMSLMLLTVATKATRVQAIHLHAGDGSEMTLTLSQTLVITFDENRLIATDDGEEVSIPLDGLNWNFEDVNTAIQQPRSNSQQPRMDGNTLLFQNLPRGTNVIVSTLDGKLLSEQKVTTEGQSMSVNMADMPRGIYIVRAGKYSMKFIKK